jgi:hypothetical protein
MKRIVLATCVVTSVLCAPAIAGTPSLPEETITGRIIDFTCYGPCAPETSHRPFEGHADVVITYKKTGEQVARVSVKGSKYSVLAPPGRYRIVAIPFPEQDSNCWVGNPRRLHVIAGQSERKRLKVENVCVQ